MSARCRQDLPKLLHMLVLAALALGFLLQPILAAAGEMHELGHDGAETHAVADHSPHAPEPAPAGGAGGDDDAALHVLLHFFQCCGQAPAVMLPEAGSPPVEPGNTRPPGSRTAIVPGSLPPPLLRPPISA